MASAEGALEKTAGGGAGVAASSQLTLGRRAKWWRRAGSKRNFRYETHDGRRITKEEDLARIKSLVIPPAWREVRISPSPRSALQAIGVDKGGRVQRIYHPNFAAKRQRKKYARVERFGESLSALRRTTNEHIALEGLSKERVLAVVVRLINDLYFRVGSEESVKRYKTFGVTTLRNKHLEIKRGGRLIFKFTGKHHIKHRRILVDEDLATLMRDIKSLKSAKLFNYRTEDGKIKPVTPRDVNDYIKAATAPEFSAKDFRTWGGTLLTAIELAEIGAGETETEKKRNLVKAVKRVAERLGNTPAVCRSSYVHPAVLEAYMEGRTLEEFRPRNERKILRRQPEYEIEEIALLKMLRKIETNGDGKS